MISNYTLLDDLDNIADKIIQDCMNSLQRKSFSLFAGAGSGKTRSLVKLLRSIKDNQGVELIKNGQKVAIITYTNAASDEINNRLAYDPLFSVSTIHGFIWEQIRFHTEDIREYLFEYLRNKIIETEEKERKGRPGTKASHDRIQDLIKYNNRLSNITNVRKFIYDPNGINREYNSLTHSEVLDIGSNFLLEKPLFRKIFIQKYPILFIDESQDTHKQVMGAFLEVEKLHSNSFSIGLFGDMMQRIYFNGDKDLNDIIQNRANWVIVEKYINHRSSARIIDLNNCIRSKIDKITQNPRTDALQGFVRFYIFPQEIEKIKAENFVRTDMANITSDTEWVEQSRTKNLILEHQMAAKRLGFQDFFMPLYDSELINRNSLLDGTLSEIRVLKNQIIPLVNQINSDSGSKNFKIMEILKGKGGLFEPNIEKVIDFKECKKKAIECIGLLGKMLENEGVKTLDIVKCIHSKGLIQLPDTLIRVCEIDLLENREPEDEISKYDIWHKVLSTPYDQISTYYKYINEETEFDTHQGVKGLEFKRVMAIMDNSEERGTTFNFEKELLEGKTSHTNNLFYVICSRAIESLALVMYTNKKEEIKDVLVRNEWFLEDEIIIKDSI